MKGGYYLPFGSILYRLSKCSSRKPAKKNIGCQWLTMNSASNEELDTEVNYMLGTDRSPIVRFANDTNHSGMLSPGMPEAELCNENKTPMPTTPALTPRIAESLQQKSNAIYSTRMLAPKSLISSLLIRNNNVSKALPHQLLIRRGIVSQSLPHSQNSEHTGQVSFFVGKATSTTNYDTSPSKSATKSGRPLLRQSQSPTRTTAHLNSFNVRSQRTISEFYTMSDTTESEYALMKHSSKYLRVSRIGGGGRNIQNKPFQLPEESRQTQPKMSRNIDRTRLHLKDPHTTFLQLLGSASKQDERKNQFNDEDASDLTIVGGHIERSYTTMTNELGNHQDYFGEHTPSSKSESDHAHLIRNSSYPNVSNDQYVSGKGVPTSLLPKISTSHTSNHRQHVTLVRSHDNKYYGVIGLDKVGRKLPEKDPHFAVLPTTLSSTAFKTAETKSVPMRSVESPRPNPHSMKTLAT